MEDRTFHEDYHVEDDSEEEAVQSSDEDDEGTLDKLFHLSSKDGKDIFVKKKGISSTSQDKNVDDEDEEKEEEDDDNLTLGPSVNQGHLLYDSNVDKDNEEWMKRKRTQYQKKKDLKPSSDAVLSCPACMVTVCIDCQRHDMYKNQYRAMFVMNCEIVLDELLRYEHKNKSKKRRKKEGPGKLVNFKPVHGTEGCDALTDELYHPVKCTLCQTEIAVYDKDEVYHFFNVLESIA